LLVDIAVTSWRASLDKRTDEIPDRRGGLWTTVMPARPVDDSRAEAGHESGKSTAKSTREKGG
jgi:hypothetical protein